MLATHLSLTIELVHAVLLQMSYLALVEDRSHQILLPVGLQWDLHKPAVEGNTLGAVVAHNLAEEDSFGRMGDQRSYWLQRGNWEQPGDTCG